MPNKVRITLDKNFKPSVILNGATIDKVQGVSMSENSEGKKIVRVAFVADEVIEIREPYMLPLENKSISIEEKGLVLLWREHPEIHEAIIKLLGM